MAHDMRQVIQDQPNQIRHSLDINASVRVSHDTDAIVLAGMGGSGHPGDLLNALQVVRVPLHVHRSYGLPAIHGKKPLIIISSYSGNTEEALSAYMQAKKQRYPIMINTSGGKLAEISKNEGLPMTTIDFPGLQPRHTLFASFTGIYTALAQSGLARDITSELKEVATRLEKIIPEQEEPARTLAKKLKGVTPIFTASDPLSFVAKNFKIQTNENVKTPAFWNEFPELNHNEMIGFQHPQGKFHVVMLEADDDHPRTKARMKVTAELYQSWGLEVTSLTLPGATLLEKIFIGVSFGLWTTYFLAQEYGIDPVPVTGVENFKKRLEEVAGPL